MVDPDQESVLPARMVRNRWDCGKNPGRWLAMLIRYADWVRPTDGHLAFRLRPSAEQANQEADVWPCAPPIGTLTACADTEREVLGEDDAARFAQRVHRWSGPEDRHPGGAQPYLAPQDRFLERAWTPRLSRSELEPVLAGCAVAMRREGQVDYLLRDHHMVDVVLHHYRTTGALPTRLLHADRHSDWCSEAYLERRVPVQAATWWKLLEGLKRPTDGAPVLAERDVHFVWGRARRDERMSGRDLEAAPAVPFFLSEDDHAWERVREREELSGCDWVSVDLDYFQPAAQLSVSAPMLRDERFRQLLSSAAVRIFVLSPQFTNGGDKIDPWTIQGSLSSSVRLLNVLRAI